MDLIIKKADELMAYAPEYKGMIKAINKNLPEINRATGLFCKTQSQFMDNMLTVKQLTPLRSLRQILAEVNKAKEALSGVYYKNKKQKIEMKIKLRDIEKEKDELKKELLEVEAEEINSQVESSKQYIGGAIRKITNYMDQYNSILKEKNVKSFSEIDFEKEEERYHIMTAFDQALTAARARSGMIDEGNHIYLNQIGINGAVAQHEVLSFLTEEGRYLKGKDQPKHDHVLKFLNMMADKFEGSADKFATHKGMNGTINEAAAIKCGEICDSIKE